jgi:hypothetical protein
VLHAELPSDVRQSLHALRVDLGHLDLRLVMLIRDVRSLIYLLLPELPVLLNILLLLHKLLRVPSALAEGTQ